MTVWFTSDTHFHHKNMLKFMSSRDQFKGDSNLCNEYMIEQWNALVKPKDTIYHLGDFGWRNEEEASIILHRLNGYKILIPGNHDLKMLKSKLFRNCWDEIKPHSYYETWIDDIFVVMCHYPIYEWNRKYHGSYHLHGHVHGKPLEFANKCNIIDVGVDAHDLKPISFDTIKEIMKVKNT